MLREYRARNDKDLAVEVGPVSYPRLQVAPDTPIKVRILRAYVREKERLRHDLHRPRHGRGWGHMAAIITGASVIFERSRTGSYGFIGPEVVGAIDAGLELFGGDTVENPGRLLMGLAVLERIRLVDDDLGLLVQYRAGKGPGRREAVLLALGGRLSRHRSPRLTREPKEPQWPHPLRRRFVRPAAPGGSGSYWPLGLYGRPERRGRRRGPMRGKEAEGLWCMQCER